MPAWILPAIGAGVGLLSGVSGAKQAQRQRQQDQKMNEIEAKYSHWLSPQYRQVGPGASTLGMGLGGALTGGMQGAMLGEAFPNMFSSGTGAPTTTLNSPLGGKAMAQDLGSTFNPGIAEMKSQIAGAAATPSAFSAPAASALRGPTSVGEVFPEGYAPPSYNQGGLMGARSRYQPFGRRMGFGL